jgi:Putative peptidoglycan binding domain/Matrixin
MDVRLGPIHLAVASLLFAGCLAEPIEGQPVPSLERLSSDLQLGAHGDEVRALNHYLSEYGYFPNAELEEKYPAWSPLIEAAPADPASFDEQTARAVRLLQAKNELPVTAIVDAATRRLLKQPRCGVPDGVLEPEPSDKYSFINPNIIANKTQLTVGVVGSVSAEIQNAIRPAMDGWTTRTNFTWQRFDSSSADIVIRAASLGPQKMNRLAETSPSPPRVITMNTDRPQDQNRTTSTLAHEIGHALGFNHSDVAGALMQPTESSAGVKLVPQPDDEHALSVLYDFYRPLSSPSGASDIAATSIDHLWIVGKNAFADGFQVWKWNPSGGFWRATDGGGVRVAVEKSGIPWIVTSKREIFRRTTTDPTVPNAWQLMPGRATDIGIGDNNEVWITSDTPFGDGFQVFKFNKSTMQWIPTDGGGVRISVNQFGAPWVVTNKNQIFRRSDNSTTAGGWQLIPGGLTDLAVTGNRIVWGIFPVQGQEMLFSWNEQVELEMQPAISGHWVGSKRVGRGGPNAAVTIMQNGEAIVVDNDGAIWVGNDQVR